MAGRSCSPEDGRAAGHGGTVTPAGRLRLARGATASKRELVGLLLPAREMAGLFSKFTWGSGLLDAGAPERICEARRHTGWGAIRAHDNWVRNAPDTAKTLDHALDSGCRRGQETFLSAVIVVPSAKVKLAANGKPPCGHLWGRSIPLGW